MKKGVFLTIFVILNLGLFIFSGFLFTSSTCRVFNFIIIDNLSDEKDAVVISITEPKKNGLEKAVYFKILDDNNIYTTHLVTVFSDNNIEQGQVVHVKSDEKRKQFIINEFADETYANYIYRIVVSIFCFTMAIFIFFKVTLGLFREVF